MNATLKTRIVAGAWAGCALIAGSPLSASTFTVTNANDAGSGSLRQAITDANTAPGADTISFSISSGTITLASSLPTITGAVTITGPGATGMNVNGANRYRVFAVDAGGGAVSISGLTVSNGKALGGSGGWGGANGGGGGGGAGLGGGLFVATGSVQLNGLVFSGNSAQGGAGGGQDPATVSMSGWHAAGGGGGGMGGNGANMIPTNGQFDYGSGTGGAGGSGGILGGAGGAARSAGGPGAGGGGGSDQQNGGSGGYGGGGGGAGGYRDPNTNPSSGTYPNNRSATSTFVYAGGAGGFGAGGGGGTGWNAGGGAAGFGGGAGADGTTDTNYVNTAGGGGGGAGFGGAIFVKDGAVLTATDCTFSGNTVAGGGGDNRGGNGQGLGESIFLGGDTTISVSTSTLTLSQTLGGGSAVGAQGALTKRGAGTLVLSAANSYTGGTTVAEGTLRVTNTSGAATGTGTVSVSSGAILGGTGRVGALTLASGSAVAPGTSTGTLSAGNTTWAGGAGYTWEINKADGVAGSNSGWDLLAVTGTLTLNATSANKFTIAVVSQALSGTAGQATGFNSTSDYTFTIATATGGIAGFDANAFAINTSGFQNSFGGTWSVAQSGNNLNLVYRGAAAGAPVITTQPQSQTVAVDARVTFTVAASGSGLAYQWKKNATNLTGATNASLTLTSVQSSDAGSYTVEITNASGRVVSDAAVLTVGASGAVDLSRWTARNTSGTKEHLWSVAWNGSQFLAAGFGGTILTSPDGVTWTSRTSGTTNDFWCVVWSGNQFVAVGNSGTILTSPDGVNWTSRVSGTTNYLSGVAWSGSQFVAVGKSGTVLTSSDGATWRARSAGTTASFTGLAWGGNQFVAVGVSGTILTSPDGANWTARTSGVAVQLMGVYWTGNQFVVVLTSGLILTSPDGINWTRRDTGLNATLWLGTWGLNQHLVVGNNGTIGTSVDGVTWTSRNSGTSSSLNSVASNGSQFVIVGDYGTILTASGSTSGTGAVPVISAQPQAQSATAGNNVTFTVTATGTPAPTYQWRKDGANIAGATNATLTLTNVQAADAGSYTVVVTNTAGSITSSAGTLTFTLPPPPTAPAGSRLVNLSILTTIAAPGDTFTLGYVVGGSGTSGTKPLVIRAVGPSLGALGFPGTLDDPKMELFAGAAKTGENDNWGGSAAIANAMAAVGAFACTGPTSRDAVVAMSVASGDNSVKVSGVGSGTGAVIAEIYDATSSVNFTATTPRLVNVSVLKHLGAGLTVGFYVDGSGTKNVLVRVVGPTLGTAFGLDGVVNDPQFTLYSGQTAIGSNDNWGGTAALKAIFASAGAFAWPDSSRDAAVVAALKPGSYTVVVSGVGNTTGNALVEVYELSDSVVVPTSVNVPAGFVAIPAGTFTMGDNLDGLANAVPRHAVTLAAFNLAKMETTKAEWDEVRAWALTHDYRDILVGAGKAANHPVQSVTWYDAVKWCNARSEKEGLVPVYYTDDAQTVVYRNGDVNLTNAQVKWLATGYRLPTEAEWEYAARGGLADKRFPWGDTITHLQANYNSLTVSSMAYDVSATSGYHRTYATGGEPYTSPVGSFAANGYGLFDMTGNVWEWCWDRLGTYTSDAVTSPQGPATGTSSVRMRRGGSWSTNADDARTANRGSNTAFSRSESMGFRVVRSPAP